MKRLNPALLTAGLAAWALVTPACGGSQQKGKDSDKTQADATPYRLEYSDVMEFTRGVEGVYRIAGNFDGEPQAKVTIDGLPEGAVYGDGTLTWTPSCELSTQNGQFLSGYMVRRLRLTFSGVASDNLVQRPAIIVVHKEGEGSPCSQESR